MVSVTDDHGQSVNAFPQINISGLSLCVDKLDYKHEIFILIFCKKH